MTWRHSSVGTRGRSCFSWPGWPPANVCHWRLRHPWDPRKPVCHADAMREGGFRRVPRVLAELGLQLGHLRGQASDLCILPTNERGPLQAASRQYFIRKWGRGIHDSCKDTQSPTFGLDRPVNDYGMSLFSQALVNNSTRGSSSLGSFGTDEASPALGILLTRQPTAKTAATAADMLQRLGGNAGAPACASESLNPFTAGILAYGDNFTTLPNPV